MRRPTSPRSWLAPLLVVGLVIGACSGDDSGSDDDATSSTTAADSTTTTVDPTLAPFLVQASDLPGTYAPGGDVDDTITSFCANEDAAAGLHASSRAVTSFSSNPAGFGLVQLVFRFRGDDAARFVSQAHDVLGRCSEVPDIQGRAFAYEPASDSVEAALASTSEHVARYGVSVGSGELLEYVAVFRVGDVGVLIAVLGVRTDRAALDALAAAAVAAAANPG